MTAKTTEKEEAKNSRNHQTKRRTAGRLGLNQKEELEAGNDHREENRGRPEKPRKIERKMFSPPNGKQR